MIVGSAFLPLCLGRPGRAAVGRCAPDWSRRRRRDPGDAGLRRHRREDRPPRVVRGECRICAACLASYLVLDTPGLIVATRVLTGAAFAGLVVAASAVDLGAPAA